MITASIFFALRLSVAASMFEPVIFISAVTGELKTSRGIAAHTLQAIGYRPDWQEIFGLSADEIPAMLRKKIKAASAVLQIVGDAYGAEPGVPDPDFGPCSYTQYEALYAKSIGKPVYYLIATSDFPRDLPADKVDEPTEKTEQAVAYAKTKRARQALYKDTVRSGQTIYYEIVNSDSVENKVRKLSDELAKLRRRVWAAAAVGGVALTLILAVATASLFQLQRSASAAAQAEREQRERDVAHQEELDRQRRLAEAEAEKRSQAEQLSARDRERLLAAMQELSTKVGQMDPSGEADQATRLARAYAALEEQFDLPAGALSEHLPSVAAEILASSASTPLQRMGALYAGARYAEAEKLGQEIAEAALQGDPPDERAAAEGLFGAGFAAMAEERSGDALGHFERGRSLIDQEEDPALWAWATCWIGSALRTSGQYAQAVETLREAVELQVEYVGMGDRATIASMDLLAGALREAGEGVEAALWCERTLTIKVALFGNRHPETLAGFNSLALAYQEAGRVYEAVDLLEMASSVVKSAYGEGDVRTVQTLANLGFAYQRAGRNADAIPVLETALEINRKALGEDDPLTLNVMNNLAVSYQLADRSDESIALLEKAFALEKAAHGPNHPETVGALNNLAMAYQDCGRIDEAIPLLEQVASLALTSFGPDHPRTPALKYNLALAYQKAGRLDEALSMFRETVALRESHPGVYGDEFLYKQYLAACLREMKRLDEALALLENDMDEIVARYGEISPYAANGHHEYGLCLLDAGRQEEAVEQLRLAYESTRDGPFLGADQLHVNYTEPYAAALEAVGKRDEAKAVREGTVPIPMPEIPLPP